jgi:outer membrane protein, heavy metal efflux system
MTIDIMSKSIKHLLILAGAIFVLAPVFIFAEEYVGASDDALTLDIITSQVVQHNDRIASMRLMEKSAIQNIGPSGAWDDPMLMVGVQNVPTSFKFNEDEMTMKMIGLSQNIPYTGERGLNKKAARAKADAAGFDTRESEIELITSARSIYLTLYYRQQTLKLMQSQHELQQDIVASTAAKLISNQANQSDLSAAQADLWRLESDILSIKQEVENAYNRLCGITGIERSAEIPSLAVPGLSAPLAVDSWLDAAKVSYPSLKRTQSQADSYRFSAAAARRMRWPMLSISGSYGFRSGSTTDAMTGDIMVWGDMISVQANISLPIFSGRQQNKMALSMISMSRSFEAEGTQIWRDTEAELRSLFSKSRNLSQSLSLYRERIIPADEDAYNSAYAGFTANRVALSSLISSAINIYRDRLTANQLEYQLSQTLVDAGRYTIDPDSFK